MKVTRPTVEGLERIETLREVGHKLIEALESDAFTAPPQRVQRRWVRSPVTDAIVNGGPDWKPGRPFTDYVRNQRRNAEDEEVGKQ